MRVLEKQGWTVHIEIHPHDIRRWNLQIAGGRGNSTVWTDTSGTDQAAFRAALRAIDAEGIETFIGPVSQAPFLALSLPEARAAQQSRTDSCSPAIEHFTYGIGPPAGGLAPPSTGFSIASRPMWRSPVVRGPVAAAR